MAQGDDGRVAGWLSGLGLGAAAGFAAQDLDLPSAVSYWGDRAPLVLAAAALGAALGATRLRGAPAALALLLLAAWCAVAFTPLTGRLAADLPRRDPLVPADAICVLGSRVQSDGEPTATALSRLLRGLELLAEERAPRLVIPEQPAPSASYAALARAEMDRLGVAGELLAVGPAGSTREEALAVAALGRERGWRRLILVTSPTHSRRAAAAFEHEGFEVVSRPSPETLFDLETLDRSDDRLRAFGSLLHERLGLVVYRQRGWIRD